MERCICRAGIRQKFKRKIGYSLARCVFCQVIYKNSSVEKYKLIGHVLMSQRKPFTLAEGVV